MKENREYDENSQAVQTHLGIMQALIQRMAGNSASCKTWCITLVSAILVLVIDKGKQDYSLVAVIPVLSFLFLDTYYLALEKGFRQSYNTFIAKLHDNLLAPADLFSVSPPQNLAQLLWKSLQSFSIWPFYLALTAMICIAASILD